MVSLLVLSVLSSSHTFLGLISIAGGVFVFYMGWENFKIQPFESRQLDAASRPLAKGILVNFLSPHPYLFWITVGAPTVIKASAHNFLAPALFITAFYFILVGSKVFLAFLTSRSRSFLVGRKYIVVMRLLGIILCCFAVLLWLDGLKFLEII